MQSRTFRGGKPFLDTLKAFIELFGDLPHIKRFKAVCRMPHHIALRFKRWKLTVFSWRFENLEFILVDLFASFEFMPYFNLQAMLGNSKVQAAIYTAVDAGFRDPLFTGRAQVLLVATHRTGHWMRWIEGCPCHDHLLIACKSYAARRALLESHGVVGGIMRGPV